MPNQCCKILTVAEEMLKKITERYIWKDKNRLEKYESDNTFQSNGNKNKQDDSSKKERR